MGNDLNNSYQFVYRSGYSTETVLLKVHSDIAEDLDECSWFIWSCCYNQSSATTEAFGIFWIQGKTLIWVKPYQANTTEYVLVAD